MSQAFVASGACRWVSGENPFPGIFSWPLEASSREREREKEKGDIFLCKITRKAGLSDINSLISHSALSSIVCAITYASSFLARWVCVSFAFRRFSSVSRASALPILPSLARLEQVSRTRELRIARGVANLHTCASSRAIVKSSHYHTDGK